MQMFAGRAVVEGYRGDAAGHRFEGGVAEGLAVAGKQEQIGTGEMARDFGAALKAAEDKVWMFLREFLARRPIAYPHEAGIGAAALEFAEGADRKIEVLF